ncbi:hypothetical protein ACFY2R_15925 [Micromonospora olivasterospora]|uniref:Uncharacterized protein n=1 Tax=Micromonospora olivasterospora TaxID=1880 RepID=A0A562IGL8_MICOL|nr:hypothetical protein [Micromonospora olivasterospora]TWH70147.1 hypothetical protein JD77_05168 [Micromonospora olivasterospora]
MNTSRIGDMVVSAAGNVAGTVVDPRQGLTKLRSMVTVRGVVAVAAGAVIGFLALRAARRG